MRMLVRRLAQVVVVILVVTFFTAILTDLLPGDPVKTMAPTATPAQRAEISERLGLDKGVAERYRDWTGACGIPLLARATACELNDDGLFATGARGFFTGDMGRYYESAGVRGREVSEAVGDSLPRSALLVLYVQILTLLIAVPLGVLSAYRAGSLFDRGGNGTAFALVALPTFVLAALLKYWFGLRFDLLPTRGYVSFSEDPVEHIKTMIMPVLTITVGQIAIYARLLRSDMVATLQEDFILMAKAKGIPNRRILWHHALRPSSLTLLTVAGLNIGALVGGALIVERVFDTDGLGSLIYDAIGRRQYVALQSFIAVIAVLYVAINFFVDLLYTVLDPRIRNA